MSSNYDSHEVAPLAEHDRMELAYIIKEYVNIVQPNHRMIHGLRDALNMALTLLGLDEQGNLLPDLGPTMSWSKGKQCWVWSDGTVVEGAVLRPEQLVQPSTDNPAISEERCSVCHYISCVCDDEVQVEGCSCGMADKGAPGHDHADKYQWEPTVTIDVPGNPNYQGSVYRMRSHGQASGTEDREVLLWETGNVFLPLANLIDDAFGDNEHPADCGYCQAGEGMAHTYEPNPEGEPGLDSEKYTPKPALLRRGVSVDTDENISVHHGLDDCVWWDHTTRGWAGVVGCSGRMCKVTISADHIHGNDQSAFVCEAHFNAPGNPYHH